jgi:hypothetical protein
MNNLGSRARLATLAACALALPTAAQAAPFATGDLHAKASRPAARTLLGLTSQFPCKIEESPLCGTVTANLARNGRRLKRVSIAYEATCGVEGMFFSGLVIANGFPGSGPRFSKPGQVQQDLGEGRKAIGDITLKGRLNAKRGVASGTFRVVTRIYDPGQDQGGQPLDTCDSGAISWVASRPTRRG